MPTQQQARVDKVLTNMSVAYFQEEANFIATKVFPLIPVKKQSDLYYTYNKGDFFRDDAKVRAGGTESAGGDYGMSTEPYYCRVHAFHKDVNEQDRANYDDVLDADADATEFVSSKMLIRRERIFAEKFFAPGVWTKEIEGIATGTPNENQVLRLDQAASDPIKIITNEAILMAGRTGFKPNTLVMTPGVFYSLKNHEDILDRIKYTQKGVVTTDLLATLFEVENVYVSWAVVNDANEGEDDNMNFMMGNHMLLCYVNPRPAMKKPSAGYTFAWTGYLGASAVGSRIVRIPMDILGLGTERIEGELAFDGKVIAQDLGVFFKDIVG